MSETTNHTSTANEQPNPDDELPATGPAQPALLRDINERVVLDTIREVRTVSRAEIARRTGLSKPTVSLAIRTLESNSLVAPVGMESGRPGRAGVLYAAVSDAALAVAIEIGVGAVRGQLVDLDGHVIAERTTPIRRPRAQAAYDAVATCVDSLTDESDRARSLVTAVTVGTPGVIHPNTGVLTQAGTMPELDGSNPADELSARLHVDVTVFNDVDLAALGERAEGAGREVEDFAVVWVGTGLGAALILHGDLHRGHRGGAGEIFDIPFGGGIDASAAGTVALAAQLAQDHPSTRLTPPFQAAEVLDAAALGDPLGAAVRDRLAQWVAWYAAAVTAVVDPQLIVLAGSVGSHDSLWGPVAAHLADLLLEPPRLVSSKLGERAVLAGAAAEARRDAVDRSFAGRALSRVD